MNFMLCFVLLCSGILAGSRGVLGSWSRGSHKSGETCAVEHILEEKVEESVSLQDKFFDSCTDITYVQYADYADPIAIVTVPKGNVDENTIQVEIKARKYLNGTFTICTLFELAPSCVLPGPKEVKYE